MNIEDFRALARSSPWLWRTMRFSIEFESSEPGHPRALRAFVDRPHGIRVEGMDGILIQATWQPSATAGLPEITDAPVHRTDGLIARRPGKMWEGDPYRYDDPMFSNYRWVAMLHPFELADGVERDEEDRQLDGWSPDWSPITAIDTPREVDHFDRRAWEALITTTSSYAARCSCCPLLDGPEAARQLDREGWSRPTDDLPQAWSVRLDRETGVVVRIQEIEGHSSGGWTMRIEDVDSPMPRDLFGEPLPGRYPSR